MRTFLKFAFLLLTSFLFFGVDASTPAHAQQLTYPAEQTANQFTNTNQFLLGIQLGPIIFANLPPTAAVGSIIYCLDCTANSTPCSASGTGAFASYVFGAWSCAGFGGGGGGGGGNIGLFPITFVNATVAILPTTYQNPPLITQCWDSNNVVINGYSAYLSVTTPYTVYFGFGAPQSGYCTALGMTSGSSPLPPSGLFSVTPSATNFLSVPQGTTSPLYTTTITNNSASTVNSITVGLSGPNAADFSTSLNNTCTSSLASSAACTFQTIFSPSTAGPESAIITVTDTAGTQTVGLSGIGYVAGNIPDVLASYSSNSSVATSTSNIFGICTGGSSGITLTLPTPAGATGRKITLLKADSGIGTCAIVGSVNFPVLTNQYQYVVFESNNSNWYTVGNN